MRHYRDDIAELKSDISDLRDTDFDEGTPSALAGRIATALDTVVNVFANLADELEEAKAEIARLKRER